MNNTNFKTGVVADVGYAEYKGKETFYLVLQNEKGENAEPIRGKGLEEAFNKVGDLNKGDAVNLKDFGIDEATKKRVWEIERHEPYQDLNNEISQDKDRMVAKEKSPDEVVQEAQNAWQGKTERKIEDFDNLPDNIKNNYVGIVKNKFLGDEKVNYYDKGDDEQVNIAFEDRKDSLNTSRQDEKTINAMLDLASSKGWTAIKLKGTEEFKQKAWLEAPLRGIETKGYKPTERDLATLQSKQKERNSNTVIAEKIEEPTQNQEQTLEDKENTPIENNHQDVAKKTKETDLSKFVQEPTKEQPKTEKEIKQEIKMLVQNGIKDGSIKERADVVKKLKENGFNVIRENEKSITLLNPNGKDLRLEGEVFTKNYNAIKSLTESLKPENIKEKYPKMSDENIAKVDLWRQEIFSRYESQEAQQNALSRLNNVLLDVESSKRDLGTPIPANEIKPEIEVRTPDSGDQSRSR